MADDERRSPDHRYDAFLSYSHSEIGLAKRLSQRIRRYRPPRRMGLGKKRLVPFRDVEQLTASSDLSDTLIARLDASRSVILLCSPAAAGSRYVHEEIDYFLRSHEPKDIVIALCDGEAETSIPAVLRERSDEALFVDLRPESGRIRAWRTFRAQTLRIIAALYGVDYSKLTREDERRRRRLRVVTSAATLVLAGILTSIYLITTIQPFAWADQRLPRTGMQVASLIFANPLMPIRDIAFRRDRPETQIYRVRDAEYHGQKPDNAVFIDAVQMDIDRDSLVAQLTRAIAAHVDPLTAPSPFARFNFSIEDEEGMLISRGASHFFPAGVDRSGEPLFYEVLSVGSTRPDSASSIQPFVITPRTLTPYTSIVDWPDQDLVDRGLMPRSGTISGSFHNLLDGSTTSATFRINDAMEVFRDAIGPDRFDMRLGSNDAELEVDYGGTPMRLSDVDGEVEIWDDLIASGEWVVYSPPVRHDLSLTGRRSRTEDSLMHALEPPVDGAASLASRLVASDILEMDDASLSIVSRQTDTGWLQLATLMGRSEHGIAYSVSTTERIERLILFRRPGADWQPIQPPTNRVGATPFDIVPLDAGATRLLLVLSGEGIAYSSDSGRTWQDFNLGERRLATDGNIEVIPVGTPPAVHVLVDNDIEGDGSRENFLFRLDGRSWRSRLRLALVRLLQTEAAGDEPGS